jgi:transcription-repair coupling factor (superfamily II helicase)
VEYAGRDRLFVPVEQLDRLRRYSYDGTEPKLNSLGKEQWRKTKEKVRQDTIELAKRLLSLYKARRTRAGYSYSERTVWEDEFAEGFPYNMTEDQLSAWRAVERDMEAAKPMDRLLCGDVGFGKTEIALRAAFKSCVDERQALVLCPTTVLADQHYHTFSRRFKPFPFRVAQLSRFQSKAEQKDTIAKLHEGRVDVVIATHRALSKDVGFKRLGLLVIDEEQRFGVTQKEKMKMRWTDVDVLAMSATPIPRTLHMSLIGLRDISLIETAPIARKPVKTYVGEHDEIMVREAILRELGRGGQVYYLHNRVQDIERVKQELERLIEDEKVVIAHGQMREDKLEEVMRAFSLGAYKIMLATTIIENGLDIPSVNTMVVSHAENLGLSQMHQLRGRVGRSAVQAYAYFFHQPNRILSEEAQNRLHAIYNYAYLGAGYEIAQSDLRIRGAGNLLGEAQSGLAKAVGFEYYCELLARSISDVKALDEADIEEWEDTPLAGERPGAQVDLPLPCFIPDDYISDPVLRLDILRDLAALASEEALAEFAAALADRFGEPPPEVHNLLLVVRIRNLAAGLGIQRVSFNRGRGNFELRLYDDEGDWHRSAPLVDSRFSKSPQGGMLLLAMGFDGQQSAEDLHDAISSLKALKQ